MDLSQVGLEDVLFINALNEWAREYIGIKCVRNALRISDELGQGPDTNKQAYEKPQGDA